MLLKRSVITSLPVSIAICVSACLSGHISQKQHVQISPNFLYMLHVLVAQSSSDGNVRCYTCPVLWTTSCFHIMNRIGQIEPKSRRFVQFASEQERHRGRNLPSPTASCCVLQLHLVLFCFSIHVERTLTSTEAMWSPQPTASRSAYVMYIMKMSIFFLSVLTIAQNIKRWRPCLQVFYTVRRSMA